MGGYRVDDVELIGDSSPTYGADVTLEFSGIGLSDNDIVKWVSADDAQFDADCNSLQSLTIPTKSYVRAFQSTVNFGVEVQRHCTLLQVQRPAVQTLQRTSVLRFIHFEEGCRSRFGQAYNCHC